MFEYFWGIFVKKKSRIADVSVLLKFMGVELLINYVRLKKSQTDLKTFDTDVLSSKENLIKSNAESC